MLHRDSPKPEADLSLLLSLPLPTAVGSSWELETQKMKIMGWDKNNLLETAMK